MRLLVVSDYWPTNGNAVSGVFVEYQVQAYCRAGHTVEVIAPVPLGRQARQRAQRIEGPGYRVWSPRVAMTPGLPRMPARLRAPLFVAGVRAWGRGIRGVLKHPELRGSFDAVHLHGHAGAGLSSSGWARELQVPKVLTLHGEDPLLACLADKASVRESILACWDAVDRVTVVGSPLVPLAHSYGAPAGKVSITPNGNDHFPAPRARRAGPPRIACVGNLLPTKGVATLIEALRELARDTSFECTIVGDGPERQRIECAVQIAGLAARVRLAGRLSHAATLAEISDADVFCLPSTVEAFGIVYLEAMAAGVPPIGCATTGAADLIVDSVSGWLVPPGDARSLGAALREALTNEPERRRRALFARLRAEQFTWDRNVGAMEKLIHEARKPRPAEA